MSRERVPSHCRSWGPPLAWMTVIFTLSSQSKLPIPPQPLAAQLVRVGGHMAAFGTLLLLLLRAMKATWPRQTVIGWALLVTLLYALADEYHQSFVPGRHATLMDVTVDAAGMVLALGVLSRRRLRHHARG